jgi:aryl-alcohol dehydrogenase-like predicted oxidoreductase
MACTSLCAWPSNTVCRAGATVQNVYNLISRTAWKTALDETMHRLGVSLLAYSPLAFGLLTGKYDASGTTGPDAPQGGAHRQIRVHPQTALGPPRVSAAAKRYNALAQSGPWG